MKAFHVHKYTFPLIVNLIPSYLPITTPSSSLHINIYKTPTQIFNLKENGQLQQ